MDTTRALERKHYTRSDLFRLAKLMNNDKSIQEDLNKLERNSLQQAEALGRVPDPRQRSLSNLSRQRSEIESLQYELDPDLSRSQPRSRISRMSSSPMLKYSRSKSTREPTSLDAVSSQVQERHAMLLESLLGDQSRNSRDFKPARQSVDLPKSTRRPNQLFGPLRREGSRRGSEEPMSLPYMHTSAEPMSMPISTKWATNSSFNLNSASDDVSPILRINSDQSRSNAGMTYADDGDEDEFDITSLLSITVLSDIKAIRLGEVQSVDRKPSSKQHMVKNLHRDSSSTRTFSRARTSTDFTFNGRHSRDRDKSKDYQNDLKLGYQSSGPYSLIDCGWSYSNSAQVRPDVAQQPPSNKLEPKKEKAVDESVAHIIETFKAQVKARAASESIQKSTEDEIEKAKADSGLNKVYSSPNQVVRSEATAGGERSQVEQQNVTCKPIDPPASSSASSGLEQDAVRDPDTSRASQGEADTSKVEKKVRQAGRISNIPRLIRAPLKPLEMKDDELKNITAKNHPAESAIDSKRVEGQRPLLRRSERIVSGSYVSQYKQLRGKSLADEVKETP